MLLQKKLKKHKFILLYIQLHFMKQRDSTCLKYTINHNIKMVSNTDWRTEVKCVWEFDNHRVSVTYLHSISGWSPLPTVFCMVTNSSEQLANSLWQSPRPGCSRRPRHTNAWYSSLMNFMREYSATTSSCYNKKCTTSYHLFTCQLCSSWLWRCSLVVGYQHSGWCFLHLQGWWRWYVPPNH